VTHAGAGGNNGLASIGGRRVLIVGGAGNVGRHLVQGHVDAGATVIVPSRSPERLDELASFISSGGPGRIVPVTGDITSVRDQPGILREAGPIDGAVASLGRFVAAPSVLEAPQGDLERVLNDYLLAHLMVARAVIPVLRGRGGGYVMINGPLAFDPLFPGVGLVSIATAAQAMLARVLMQELAGTGVRVNELVIYSSFGRDNEEENVVAGADVGRYVVYLLSDEGAAVSGESIHLRAPALHRAATQSDRR
jgi:NAD(P)-dependent dehydrogenase (short-subunit alcohol dehydrogenase family)